MKRAIALLHCHGIDAELWHEPVFERHVECGKPEGTSAFIPVNDASGNRIGPTQKLGCLVRISICQQSANSGRGNLVFVLSRKRCESGVSKRALASIGLKQRGITPTVMAEHKVRSRHHMRHAMRLHQYPLNELLC